jgi:hypothetical protein
MVEPVCLFLPEYGKVVAMVQRAASTSMSQLLNAGGDHNPNLDGQRLLRPHDAHELGVPIIMWIRDPFARAASAHHLVGDMLWDLIGREYNVHWIPQVDLHTGTHFYPTTVYPFETISETWEKEFPGLHLPHKRKKPHPTFEELNLSRDIVEKLTSYYADDIKLREDLGY